VPNWSPIEGLAILAMDRQRLWLCPRGTSSPHGLQEHPTYENTFNCRCKAEFSFKEFQFQALY